MIIPSPQKRPLRAELQDVSGMILEGTPFLAAAPCLLWGWRGYLEVKVVDLTLGRSTASGRGARLLAMSGQLY